MPASKDRLTVILRVVHQRFGRQPKSVDFTYSRALGLDGDEPWSRDAKVSEEWKPLELGWCEDQKIAYIVIANIADTSPVRGRPNPEASPEEIGDESKWLELKYEDSQHCFYLPIDEAIPFIPSAAAALRIRVRTGSKRYRIFAIPQPE